MERKELLEIKRNLKHWTFADAVNHFDDISVQMLQRTNGGKVFEGQDIPRLFRTTIKQQLQG